MESNSSNKIPIIIISVGLAILLALAAYYVLVLKDKPKEVLEYNDQTESAVSYDEEGNKYINGQLVVTPGIKYSLNDGNMTIQELTNTYLEFVTAEANLYIPSRDCFIELENINDSNSNDEGLSPDNTDNTVEAEGISEDIVDNTIIPEDEAEITDTTEFEEATIETEVVDSYIVEATLYYSNEEAKDFITDIYLSSDEGVIEPISKLDKDNSIVAKFSVPCTIHPGYLKLNYGVNDYLTVVQKQLTLIVKETIINGEAS